MPHHIYTTEAFVVARHNTGDADCFLALFTREFGMVHAIAKSVRAGKSKLKFSLQTFSLTSVSLVRGKSGWRIVFAREGTPLPVCAKTTEKLRLLARVFSLLRRLVRGEERNEELYGCLAEGARFLERELLTGDELARFERLFVLRVLHHLGYGGGVSFPRLAPLLLVGDIFRRELLDEAALGQDATSAINEALVATHL